MDVLKDFLQKKLELHKENFRLAIINHKIREAYEYEIIIKSIEELIRDFDNEIDLQQIIKDHFCSSKQAAAMLNKSHATIIRQVQKGKIEAVKLGRDYFIDKKEIDNITE